MGMQHVGQGSAGCDQTRACFFSAALGEGVSLESSTY